MCTAFSFICSGADRSRTCRWCGRKTSAVTCNASSRSVVSTSGSPRNRSSVVVIRLSDPPAAQRAHGASDGMSTAPCPRSSPRYVAVAGTDRLGDLLTGDVRHEVDRDGEDSGAEQVGQQGVSERRSPDGGGGGFG